MAELLAKLQQLQDLNGRQHWFCGAPEAADSNSNHQLLAEPARLQLIAACLQFFAFPFQEVEKDRDRLVQGIDRQLGRCEACIVNYYRIKRDVLEKLRVEYEDDDVEQLSNILHEYELQRIRRGLGEASAKLQSLPQGQGTTAALPSPQLHAIIEALSCEKFLIDSDTVSNDLLDPFGRLSDHDTISTRYLPAMTEFLFTNVDIFRKWAHRALANIPGAMTTDDFDFAVRGALERILSKATVPPYDPTLVRLLWGGLTAIVLHLDQNVITHSLRSLDVDVYKLALEHLQLDDEALRYILQTIRALLVTSPKDLWEALGAISPTTVAEQVFRSPRFENTMLNARQGEAADSSSPLSDMFSWIVPLVDSLQIGNQPPVCRSITDQILSRVRSNALSPEARTACWREATRLLAQTLAGCNESTSLSDAVGRAVAADALSLGNAYLGDILDILERPRDDGQARALAANCIVIVRSALALECKIIYSDRAAVAYGKHMTPVTSIHAPGTWRTVGRRLSQDNVNLARAILGGSGDILYLERLRPAGNVATAKENKINEQLDDLFKFASNALERINYFSPGCLKEMIQYPETSAHLVTAVLCAEQSVHQSAVELMKTATAQSFRRDALRSLLSLTMKEPLDALAKAMNLICYLKSFEPCTRLLRVCGDVTLALCDSQDGILRSATKFSPATVDAMTSFWEHHWNALKMMADCSEKWNLTKAASRNTLAEFVRDVMQTSEALFDQFNVFNNIIAHHREDGTEKKAEEAGTQELLSHPSEATEGLMRYLRLKDEYLLRTSVDLIRKLLTTLTKYDLKLPSKTSSFLTEVAIWNDAEERSRRFGIKTLLMPTEIAGIGQDLESNVGYDIVQQARDAALIERDMIEDSDAGNRLASPGLQVRVPLQQAQKKQGVIDLTSWGVKAESTKDVARKPIPGTVTQKRFDKKENQKPQSLSALERATVPRQAPGVKSKADQDAFLAARKKAKEEQERRKQEQLAKMKKNIPGLIASNEGSALAGTGRIGKDHTPKAEVMMVSSDETSEESSEDELDRKLFAGAKNRTTKPVEGLPKAPPKPRGPVKKMRVQRSAKDMRARLAPQMTGLYAKLLSWEFFHEGDFPPGSSRGDFAAVKDSFSSAAEYRKAFESLLLLEAWSSFCKAREETSFRPFEVKVANRISVDSLFEVSVSLEFPLLKELGVMEADILVMSKHDKPHESPKEPHCLGRVSKVRPKGKMAEVTIQVATGQSVQPWITQGTSTYAVKLESMITLEREYGALCGLEWYDLCQEIVRAEVSPILNYPERMLQTVMKNYRLNLAQAKAVQSAIDNDAFTLIQGPPGSGKTKTIVAIVGALLTNALRAQASVTVSRPTSGGPTQPTENVKKLLVCAPSNAAVDELVMRFMQGVKTADGTFHKPNVLRLGRSDRVNPQVLKVTLDEKIQKILNPIGEKVAKEESELQKAINAHKAADAELKEIYNMFDEMNVNGVATSHEQTKRFETVKRQKQSLSTEIERLRDSGNTSVRDVDIKRRQAEQKVLNDSQIICATLSGSARETFRHLTVDFESVVIDEAAQCIELSALIPLKYGCAKCIMVGDPKQLPPTVFSREAARFQYEQSLFVRMQRNRPQDVHLLDTQYRMHPDISRFPSQAFYDGRLLDGPDMAALRTQPWHADPLLGPYRFYDVAGRHSSAPRGHSLINAAEVDAALALYQRLVDSVRDYDWTGKIGVITPYKSQLRLLGDRFAAVHGPDVTQTIEFNTTDAFQGREAEIIIFSCVRASDRGIGFLADIRRMNVGITRAKSSLWVLGNAPALAQGEFWGKMVADAKERRLLTQGNVVNVLRQTPKVAMGARKTVPSAHLSRPTSSVGKPPEGPTKATPKALHVPSKPQAPVKNASSDSESDAISLGSNDSSQDTKRGIADTIPGLKPDPGASAESTVPSMKPEPGPDADIAMPDAPYASSSAGAARGHRGSSSPFHPPRGPRGPSEQPSTGASTPKRKRSSSSPEPRKSVMAKAMELDGASSARSSRNGDGPTKDSGAGGNGTASTTGTEANRSTADRPSSSNGPPSNAPTGPRPRPGVPPPKTQAKPRDSMSIFHKPKPPRKRQ